MKKGLPLLEEIRRAALPDREGALWYVGQMGVILKFRGQVLVIDPVFNDLLDAVGNTRRNYPAPFDAKEFDFVDYVLGTHGHRDHINLETLLPLQRANPEARFLMPAPECASLERGGIRRDRLLEVVAGQTVELGEDFSVTPVAAAHEEYRTDELGRDFCLGYVIRCGSFCIYHAGDTLVTERLVADLSGNPSYGLALLPINGRDEERHGRGIIGNMDFREAADFAHRIHAGMVIPLHYDMVKGNGEEPGRFAGYMEDMYPGDVYRIMRLGEKMRFSL